jgi:hypothetical protein
VRFRFAAPLSRLLSVSEVEWLGVIVDYGLKAQSDAHHVRRARDATMAMVDEPYGATDFRRSGESFECDEGAAIVHDPLRQLDLACTTRESAARAQVVERAVPRDGRIETEVKQMRSSLLRQRNPHRGCGDHRPQG